MQVEYIIAICAGSVFLLLLLAYIILHVQRQKKEMLHKMRLEQMYADKNLVKMKYDFLVYDEETEKIITEDADNSGEQTSETDPDTEELHEADNMIFRTVDTEGLEEIVGNYKPE